MSLKRYQSPELGTSEQTPVVVDWLRTMATATVGVVATFVAGILIVGIAAIRPNAPVINSIERTWARLILNVAGVRVEIHHAHRIGRDQAYIVIANHRSIFDIMCLFAVLPLPIRFFTKRELFSIPFFGTMLRSLGMVSIDRSAADHAKINAASAGALDCGSSLIVFAEGTRGSAAG